MGLSQQLVVVETSCNLGDNCIQNFHLGRYIVGYKVGNLVYGYSLSNVLLQSRLKSCIKPHKGVRHPTKNDAINDVKLFPTVYRRIYCRKFLTLSNQTSRYKSMCIRIDIYRVILVHFRVVGALLKFKFSKKLTSSS